MNIKRSPLCGRNFEYFSEDPYLAGKLASGYVRGLMEKGVYACIKHFAVNSQEERRMAMNAVVDERTLREIYLTGFEIAVKEGGAKCVMSSYNELNGTYTNEDEHLLTKILRKDWGFDGMVVTDWGGSNDHTDGVKAGSNLEMPNPGLASARELIASVEGGRLKEEVIDERVDELLDVILTVTKAAEGHGTSYNEQFDIEAHHKLARRAAAECAVLLKNEGDILPLAKGTKVAVIGDVSHILRHVVNHPLSIVKEHGEPVIRKRHHFPDAFYHCVSFLTSLTAEAVCGWSGFPTFFAVPHSYHFQQMRSVSQKDWTGHTCASPRTRLRS